MRKYDSTRLYGTDEVEVYATEFESYEDGSCWPEDIGASLNGEEYPLTEEQRTEIGLAAVAWYCEYPSIGELDFYKGH